MHTPTVSMIIPTHNRSALLLRHLGALGQQDWPLHDLEVIVVADACTDSTVAQVQAFALTAPFQLHLISHVVRSAATTRQVGAQAARGRVFIFLDDDIAVAPGFVRAHMEAQAPNRVVLGYSRPMLPHRPTWWQRDAHRWWEDMFHGFAQPSHRYSYRDFFSGNASLAAEIFWQVNGFDLTFSGRLEDYELGYRLLKAGATFSFAPAAVGDHHDQTNLAQWQRRIRQEGIADVQIAQRHPELRNYLFDRLYHPALITRFIRLMAFIVPQHGERFERLILIAIDFCERFKLRYRWQKLVAALREYNYFCGIASMLRARDNYKRWIGEAPLRQRLAPDAPQIDLADLPTEPAAEALFAAASTKGAIIALAGVPLLALPPQPGAEPLRVEHVRAAVRAIAQQKYFPALALGMARRHSSLSAQLPEQE